MDTAQNPVTQVTGGNGTKTGAILLLLLILFLIWLDNTGRLQNIINAIHLNPEIGANIGNVGGVGSGGMAQPEAGNPYDPYPSQGYIPRVPALPPMPMHVPPGTTFDQNGIHLPQIIGVSPNGDPIFQAQ